MSKIDEILETYGNYKTVRIDWAENEQDDPFEITDGNKLLLEQAKQAIYSVLKAEMPKEKPNALKRGGLVVVDDKDNLPLRYLSLANAGGYNECLEDVAKALDKMFGVSE